MSDTSSATVRLNQRRLEFIEQCAALLARTDGHGLPHTPPLSCGGCGGPAFRPVVNVDGISCTPASVFSEWAAARVQVRQLRRLAENMCGTAWARVAFTFRPEFNALASRLDFCARAAAAITEAA